MRRSDGGPNSPARTAGWRGGEGVPALRRLLSLGAILLVAAGAGSTVARGRDAGPASARTAGAAPRPVADSLVILHTNDVHSHLEPFRARDGSLVGGAAARAALVAREREEAPGLLLLDAGDLVQGTPIYNLFHGVPETKIQSAMRYDAAALGNHDLDDGPAAWRALQRFAVYPTLSANVFAAADSAWAKGLEPVDAAIRDVPARWIGGAKVPGRARLASLARPDTVFVRRGVRVAIFGLTTGTLDHIVSVAPNGGVAVADPIAVARVLVPRLRERADLVIALTHLGVEDDKRLADLVPGIDLIVGGHSHTVLRHPIRAGRGAGPWSPGTTIVQAGAWGEYVGRAVVTLASGRPTAIADRLLEVRPEDGEDPTVAAMLRPVADSVRARTGSVVFHAGARVPAPTRRDVESPLADFAADAIREAGDADVGLVNVGAVRAALPRGAVTAGDVMTVLPFDDQVVVLRMTGDRLRGLLDFVARRVGTGGFAAVSGVTFTIRGDRAGNIRVGGRVLEGSRVYRVATVDFLVGGGDGYVMLAEAGEPEETGLLLHEAAVRFLRRHPDHAFERDGRVVWEGGSPGYSPR
ncbi:MAG: bifunctional metallophosphatase/5'-nucleotidase [Hyphomicrobiales bacterium]